MKTCECIRCKFISPSETENVLASLSLGFAQMELLKTDYLSILPDEPGRPRVWPVFQTQSKSRLKLAGWFGEYVEAAANAPDAWPANETVATCQ